MLTIVLLLQIYTCTFKTQLLPEMIKAILGNIFCLQKIFYAQMFLNDS